MAGYRGDLCRVGAGAVLLGAGTSQGTAGCVSDWLVRFWRAREDLSDQKGRID